MTQWDEDFNVALESLCRSDAAFKIDAAFRPNWIAELSAQIANEAAKVRATHEAEEDAREHADHRRIVSAFLSSCPSRTKDQIEDAVLGSLGKAFDRQKLNAALWYLLDNKDICVVVHEDGSHRFDLDIPF